MNPKSNLKKTMFSSLIFFSLISIQIWAASPQDYCSKLPATKTCEVLNLEVIHTPAPTTVSGGSSNVPATSTGSCSGNIFPSDSSAYQCPSGYSPIGFTPGTAATCNKTFDIYGYSTSCSKGNTSTSCLVAVPYCSLGSSSGSGSSGSPTSFTVIKKQCRNRVFEVIVQTNYSQAAGTTVNLAGGCTAP